MKEPSASNKLLTKKTEIVLGLELRSGLRAQLRISTFEHEESIPVQSYWDP